MNSCGNIPNIQGIDGSDWFYSDMVKDHFLHPRNFLIDEKKYEADGFGITGSSICGDMMSIFIKVYKDKGGEEKIKECKWQTFGCASAIASTSMMSIMVTENGGMSLKRAKKLKPQEIIERLGGLPEIKFHCSVLSHEALRSAVENYEKNNKKK